MNYYTEYILNLNTGFCEWPVIFFKKTTQTMIEQLARNCLSSSGCFKLYGLFSCKCRVVVVNLHVKRCGRPQRWPTNPATTTFSNNKKAFIRPRSNGFRQDGHEIRPLAFFFYTSRRHITDATHGKPKDQPQWKNPNSNPSCEQPSCCSPC